MSAILYARVSTEQQAERELSLPAQKHAMNEYANDHKYPIFALFDDVASGRELKNRPGLLAAMAACSNKQVDMLIVHKFDRISRNIHQYLSIKSELQKRGVRLVSVVEHTDSSPIGQFVEHLLAAQAEFYSANLAQEVKKGMSQRLKGGRWHGVAPTGYLNQNKTVAVDPARAKFMRLAFERWSTGEVTSSELADELHALGFISRTGKKVQANRLCSLLKNPFYYGLMVVGGKQYLGTHQPLISKALFDKCQQVFQQKRRSGKPRRRLTFLLSRLIRCPSCYCLLSGEQHTKKSGRVYRYYRCHRRACKVSLRGDELERNIISQLLEMNIKVPDPSKEEGATHTRRKRDQLRDDQMRELWKQYKDGKVTLDTVFAVDPQLKSGELDNEFEVNEDFKPFDEILLQDYKAVLREGDLVEKTRVLARLISRIELHGNAVSIVLNDEFKITVAQPEMG